MNTAVLNARARRPENIAYNRGFYHAFDEFYNTGKSTNKRQFVKDAFKPFYDKGYAAGERYRRNLEADFAKGGDPKSALA